jgi:hypothetical protein
VTHPTDRTEPAAPHGVRRLTVSRHWARGLAVAGVVALCAAPATEALASSHGKQTGTAGAKISKAARDGKASKAGRAEDKAPTDEGRWWPWGTAAHGTLTLAGKAGAFQDVSLQRGVITAVTDSTVTIASADAYSQTWTLTGTTRITGLPHRRSHPVGAEAVDPGTEPTTSTSTSTSTATSGSAPAAALTAGLAVGQEVGAWGSASTAQFLVVHRLPPRTATPTSTSTSTASSSSSSSSLA